MSYKRKHLGRRERAARKRHGRALEFEGATGNWLKLGHNHLARSIRATMCVVDSRKSGTGEHWSSPVGPDPVNSGPPTMA
jgi:hypothetical protein